MPEISEQVNSEEIDDDDDEEEENEEDQMMEIDNDRKQRRTTVPASTLVTTTTTTTTTTQELIEHHHDELRNYEGSAGEGSNDDEFFLVSSPAPFNLASVATARTGYAPDSFQIIEPSQDPDQTTTSFNRLSNIIEEDDDEEEPSKKPTANLNDVEERLNQLDSESIEQYKEMLKLGEEVSNLYRNIQNELSRPVVETSVDGDDESNQTTGVVVDYKPVMKKRVYHLNGAYLKNANNSSCSHDTNVENDLGKDD